MNRRAFVSSLAGVACARSAATVDKRPNVVFISVDDMNDWVGCLGTYEGIQTPNIDALAKRGVLFSNAHCASPLCNPSRSALLTGQAPWRTGIYNNDQFWKPNLPNAVTLPMYFKKNGYTVVGAGKVFHHTVGNNPPDQWDDFQLQAFDDPWYRRADWYPWNKRVPNPPGHPFNGLTNFQGEFDWGSPYADEAAAGDMRAVEYGEKFLTQQQAKPFFLAVGLWHPHIPMFAPKSHFDLYPPDKVKIPDAPATDLDDVPEAARKFAAVRREELDRIKREGKMTDFVHAYLAAISFADTLVGRVVKAVETSPHAKNTVIVFWSDNGWHLGEKEHVHKSTLWQRSTHVPLIFAGPGLKSTGDARSQAVSLLDIYPTLVDLCGLPKRQDLDGLSLLPQLRERRAPRPPAVITYLKGNHAVRSDRWRYIRYADGSEELYDEKADPHEYRNLAGEPGSAPMRQRLAEWLPKTNADSVPERKAFDFDFASYTYKRK